MNIITAKYARGNEVMLNSGSPKLTIADINYFGTNSHADYLVHWIDDSGKKEIAWFSEPMLQPYVESTIPEYAVGDVVMELTGGPKMHVIEVSDSANPTNRIYKCRWGIFKNEDWFSWRVIKACVKDELLIQYQELIAKMEKEFPIAHRYAEVVVYEQDDREGNYRFKIVNTANGDVLCDHLNPETADGHTYLMMVEAIRAGEKRGYYDGKCYAVGHYSVALAKLLEVDIKDIT